MNFFSKILKLYINSSIHVAIAVVAFACITFLDFNFKFQGHLIVFLFFSTIVAYTFVKYVPLLTYRTYKMNSNLRAIFIISVISLLPLIYSLIHFNIQTLSFISILIFSTLLYALPFLPRAKNLRDISGLKIFIIAFVWTGATVVLPFLSSEVDSNSLSLEKILYIGSRFLIVIALIIPFEIRDMKLDQIYLKTLPQVLGVFKSKVFAISLIVISMLLLAYTVSDTYIYVLMHLLIIFSIIRSNPRNSFLYTSLWVEAIPILWFLLKYFSI